MADHGQSGRVDVRPHVEQVDARPKAADLGLDLGDVCRGGRWGRGPREPALRKQGDHTCTREAAGFLEVLRAIPIRRFRVQPMPEQDPGTRVGLSLPGRQIRTDEIGLHRLAVRPRVRQILDDRPRVARFGLHACHDPLPSRRVMMPDRLAATFRSDDARKPGRPVRG